MKVASADLRLGRYQDVLADVECDAVIADPPYSERTHAVPRALRDEHRRLARHAYALAHEEAA